MQAQELKNGTAQYNPTWKIENRILLRKIPLISRSSISWAIPFLVAAVFSDFLVPTRCHE